MYLNIMGVNLKGLYQNMLFKTITTLISRDIRASHRRNKAEVKSRLSTGKYMFNGKRATTELENENILKSLKNGESPGQHEITNLLHIVPTQLMKFGYNHCKFVSISCFP